MRRPFPALFAATSAFEVRLAILEKLAGAATMVEDASLEMQRNWPDQAASHYVSAGDFTWHVRISGSGPVLLFVHGTGSSSHTWNHLVPELSRTFTVVAPDLPGQGLSRNAPSSAHSLPGMCSELSKLLKKLEVEPALAVGHSAGAAILISMCCSNSIAPRAVISLNGALRPFGGIGGQVFAPLAKALVLNPFVPRFLAWRARDRSTVEKLLKETGSNLTAEDVECYARLFRDPGHVAATLGMMARWDLYPLQTAMKSLQVPVVLVAADEDKTVSPADAGLIEKIIPNARVLRLQGVGHLAHEERPEVVQSVIRDVAHDVLLSKLH
jgi:magnesium chelatase accessory protein